VWAEVDVKNDNTVAGTLNIDWLRVRKYTDTEPSNSLGSEQNNLPSPSPSPSSSSSTTSDSSNSAGSSAPTPPVCSTATPGDQAPWIYQGISHDPHLITLNFSQGSGQLDHYVLEYGTQSGNYTFGADNIGGPEITSYTIKSLKPGQKYYFRVRAGNGCAVGPWSNELAVTTRSLFSLFPLEITSSKVQPIANTQSEAADQPVTNGTSSTSPNTGTPASGSAQVNPGYLVNIKVVNEHQQPVSGAKVTLHSVAKETITDKNGVASFSGVEAGNHVVQIAYQGYTGEQSLDLTGSVKEFNLNITVKTNSPFSDPKVIAALAGMGVLIIVLLGVLVAKFRNSRN